MLDIDKVYCGDCLEIMNGIDDKSIDMILCDLPYGTTACKWDVVIPFDELWKHYNRVIKDNGAIALFGSEPFSSYLRLSNIKHYKYDWYWEKDKGTGFAFSNKQPLRKIENIIIFYTLQPFYDSKGVKLDRPYKHTLPISKSDSSKGAGVHNLNEDGSRKYVWYTHAKKHNLLYFARDSQKLSMHPTQKPVELCEYLIKTYTNEDELILDNCCGSGTTGVAAKNLDRHYILIEKEEKYCQIARTRLMEL